MTTTRSRRRREPAPLEQIPVWSDGPTSGAAARGRSRRAPDAAPDGAPAVEATEPHGVEALLAGLNREQLRAVTHPAGPLLVVAGAGTGKTQVITRRIAWLIGTRRARPSEILALTFTDKAAAEMQLRVDQLVPYGYTDAAISTFHAFGDRIVREHALELGLPQDVRVLSRAEVVIFLRERLYDFELQHYRPLGDPTRFLAALAGLFSRCKDEDVSPEAYLAHAGRLAAEVARLDAASDPERAARIDTAERQAELAKAYARYQELLGAAGHLDFGDQVSLALRLVRESPSVLHELQGRFRHVLVDEFQDTNRAQSELVAAIAEPHRNVTVVGDDDQSIYRFRGAAISNILEFRGRYPKARTVVLRRNYRSSRPILDASYRLIRFNDPDRLEVREGIAKRLRPERSIPRARPVRHETFATGSEEADWVAAEIRRRIEAGARPRDVAILVRANAHADPFLRSLDLAGIPWRFSGTSGLYARPEVRLLLSFLRAVADLGSNVDVYALAASEVYDLPGEDLTAIVNMARRRHRSVWEVLEELDRQPGILRVRPATREGVRRLVADLRSFVEFARERSAGEVLYRFLRDSGILARLAAVESVASEEALRNVARFFEIVRSQSGLLADDRAIFVAPHLATLIDAGDDPPTADLDPDADAVAVLTVHKAKGLEFPVVFLVGLVAGRFPGVRRPEALAVPLELVEATLPEGDFHLQEERRLFYVGMTRARDELILTHAADYGGARARKISPFVLEALDLPLAAAPAGSGAAASPLETLATFEGLAAGAGSARSGGLRPATAGAPLPPSTDPLALSFYQIDDYLTCPLKYRYVHVVRVPIAPHHSIVYGAALHKAVQEFHRRHARGEVMSEAALLQTFEAQWSNEGFVTREHEEARLEAGRGALRRFREAQLLPGAVIPTYVERDFSFRLGGDTIRGRWDRVDIESLPEAAREAAEAAEGARGVEGVHGVEGARGAEGARGVEGVRGTGATVSADVVSPTLPLLPRERVTITDYKSSDVRDPETARQRAKESLQLSIYAMGYEAETGRLPDAVQLHFLDSGVVGRAEVDGKRLEKARGKIAEAAEGIRAREFGARPDRLACSWCAFRTICPSSAVS